MESDTSPSPGARSVTWRLVLWAVGLGVLTGLAEVCWSYLVPVLQGDDRARRPVETFVRFLRSAVTVDTALMVPAGLVVALLATARRRADRSTPSTLRIPRIMLLVGAGSYLYLGWLCLFIISPRLRVTWVYGFAGIAAIAAAAVGVVLGIDHLGRRFRYAAHAVWAAATSLLLVVTLGAFAGYCRAAAAQPEIPIADGGPRPNIVVITIDTLRHDHLGCYGNTWIDTPALDSLAADAILFDAAISQSPTTAPSHCSIMTSVYPSRHGAVNGVPMRRGLTTLADTLRANGYHTVAFTSSTTTRSLNTGLDQGFDEYVDSLVPWSAAFGRDEFQHLILFYLLGRARDSEIPGSVVSDRALDWLARAPARPYFLWLHYFDPHRPYAPPNGLADAYADDIDADASMRPERVRYAGEVAYVDKQIDRVLDDLKRRGQYDDALIVVTSDHGEAFGEVHSGVADVGHGDNLYDATQRVPLLIKPPGDRGTGRRVQQQVELMDVAPTVLALLRIPQPTTFAGTPLVDLLDGNDESGVETYAFSETIVYLFTAEGVITRNRKGERLMSLRTPRWKYIADDGADYPEFYQLSLDPDERRNVAAANASQCRTAHLRLLAALGESTEIKVPRLAPTLKDELQALGYMGGNDDEE